MRSGEPHPSRVIQEFPRPPLAFPQTFGAGLVHPLPTVPPVLEARGPVDKAWISPA
jgi:hypothetical protein